MQWSSSTLVKAGETYVNFQLVMKDGATTQGISRKHNSGTPRIWLAEVVMGGNIVSQGAYNTWKNLGCRSLWNIYSWSK